MLLPETLGKAAMKKFLNIRLGEPRVTCFSDRIKRNEAGHLFQHEKSETM